MRETAARAIYETEPLPGVPTWDMLASESDEWPLSLARVETKRRHSQADAVLAAVADHDGLAEVLRGHQERETTMKGRRPILLCECGHELHFSAEAEAAHLADVVRAWMVQP